MNTILCIPADTIGNKLWIKDLKQDGEFLKCKYRSTYNQVPFMETELWLTDGGKNFAICADDGTVLYRFDVEWIKKL